MMWRFSRFEKSSTQHTLVLRQQVCAFILYCELRFKVGIHNNQWTANVNVRCWSSKDVYIVTIANRAFINVRFAFGTSNPFMRQCIKKNSCAYGWEYSSKRTFGTTRKKTSKRWMWISENSHSLVFVCCSFAHVYPPLHECARIPSSRPFPFSLESHTCLSIISNGGISLSLNGDNGREREQRSSRYLRGTL